MSSLLVDNIGTLVTNDEAVGNGPTGVIRNAALVVDAGTVVWTGPTSRSPSGTDERVDAQGRAVVPGFVDSHAHLVFAGDRTDEFVARMKGVRYSAGGIFSTVAATREAELPTSWRRTSTGWWGRRWVGHDDHRVQVRVRPDGRGRGQEPAGCPAGDPGGDVPGRSCGASRVLRPARRLRPARLFGDARALLPRWPSGWTCSATGAPSTPTRPRPCCGPAPPGASRPGSTPTSSVPGPGCEVAVAAGAASADHCTYLTDADIELLAVQCHRGHPCCRRPSSPPVRRTRTPGGCWTPASRWPWPVTATRGRALPPISRSALPWRSGRCG